MHKQIHSPLYFPFYNAIIKVCLRRKQYGDGSPSQSFGSRFLVMVAMRSLFEFCELDYEIVRLEVFLLHQHLKSKFLHRPFFGE